MSWHVTSLLCCDNPFAKCCYDIAPTGSETRHRHITVHKQVNDRRPPNTRLILENTSLSFSSVSPGHTVPPAIMIPHSVFATITPVIQSSIEHIIHDLSVKSGFLSADSGKNGAAPSNFNRTQPRHHDAALVSASNILKLVVVNVRNTINLV